KYTNQSVFHLVGSKPTQVDIAELVNGNYKYFYINYEALASNAKTVDETTGIEEVIFPWVVIFNLIGSKIRAIIDEAHYIKNTASARARAVTNLEIKSKLLLT